MKANLHLLVLVSSFLCTLASFARELPPLPEPAFADTEVTAHHPLVLPPANVNGLNLEIAFSGTPSNNVEIALGRDEDGDGELSFDEAGVRLGWDCGVYFVERVATGERFEETSVDSDDAVRLLRGNCAVKRRALRSLSVATEAGAAFADLTASPPSWLYDANWNLMRLTARGAGVRDARFAVEVATAGISVILR